MDQSDQSVRKEEKRRFLFSNVKILCKMCYNIFGGKQYILAEEARV